MVFSLHAYYHGRYNVTSPIVQLELLVFLVLMAAREAFYY